ncbi:MAG: hypothetical protein ACRCWU_02010 [Metamycoplasmataceae bacterium]
MGFSISRNKITWTGLLGSFVFGFGVGIFVYLIAKLFKLKSRLWYIPFALMPPLIGMVIYATAKKGPVW